MLRRKKYEINRRLNGPLKKDEYRIINNSVKTIFFMGYTLLPGETFYLYTNNLSINWGELPLIYGVSIHIGK